MNARNPIRIGLSAKLAICVVASTAVFFAVFGYINLRAERRHSQDLVVQSADRISDLILRSTRYEMLHNDREGLDNVIQELGSEPGIRRIRIFNKEGRITVSTDGREIQTAVDKTAEACYGWGWWMRISPYRWWTRRWRSTRPPWGGFWLGRSFAGRCWRWGSSGLSSTGR